MRTRREAAEQAEDIIDHQVSSFMGWLRSQSSVNIIQSYRGMMAKYRDNELEHALKSLRNGQNAEQVIQRLANGLTNKISHIPTIKIRQAGINGNSEFLEQVIELFDLKDIEN